MLSHYRLYPIVSMLSIRLAALTIFATLFSFTCQMDCFRDPFPKFLSGTLAETTIVTMDVSSASGDIVVGGYTSDTNLITMSGLYSPFVALYDGTTSNINWMVYYADTSNFISAIVFSTTGTQILAHSDSWTCNPILLLKFLPL